MNKVKVEKISIEENKWQLDQPVWGDYSPSDVLRHPEKKKFAENVQRIKDADISYPIFVTSRHTIIDGYHRFLKAVKDGEKTIKAYVFDASSMKKFILHKELDYPAVHQRMQIHEVIELYAKRFC